MKVSLLDKITIVGIIFFFVGPSIVPSIGGYYNKINISFLNKSPSNIAINNDYLLAYWKFDECSGNITYDSSGHGYDGEIFGATWVSTGSGCALDFDGLDDYVSLDDHAENYLGFNRTDDLIYSFCFQSTSNDFGIIYSTSNNPNYGYKPGTHIALHPNGTIEYELWFEGICGITLFTKNSYNDGSWHFVEIWYNGIIHPLNQTITIFVDGEYDNYIESEMCSFYSDQFHLAKIGRKSYEATDYFNGMLDEFKIFKYPGGNKQEAPVISGPTNGDPGQMLNYTFITNDPENDNISLEINWDDSIIEVYEGPFKSGEDVIISHSWNENGTYNIEARSMDIWGYSDWSDPYELVIGKQPPSAPKINGPREGRVNIEYEFTFTSVDPQDSDLSYFIDWGDGSATGWTTPQTSGTSLTASHIWIIEDAFTIKAKSKNSYGLESEESSYIFIIPRNKAVNINSVFLRIFSQHSQFLSIIRYLLG